MTQFSSVQSLSHVQLFVTQGLQHARPPCPSPTSGVYSNLCPLSWWCHPTISSSVIPFSSRFHSFLASGSFPMSQFFASGSRSIGVSASASVLLVNIQDWFPLGLTGWISLLSKGLSRVFSNTTVQKHQFFGTQLSLWSISHIHTWLLEKPYIWLDGIFSRQEYWSGLSSLPPGDLLNSGIKPSSLTLQADSLPFEPTGEPKKRKSVTASTFFLLFAMKWWDLMLWS